jgi:hypothetical protein
VFAFGQAHDELKHAVLLPFQAMGAWDECEIGTLVMNAESQERLKTTHPAA